MQLGSTGTWQDGESLIAYFPSDTVPSEAGHAIEAWSGHFLSLNLLDAPLQAEWSTTDEADWITAWQAHFSPLPVGERLMVLPDWCPDSDARGRIPLKIKPGRGFGTGGHATTATCLETLEKRLTAAPLPAPTVLDVGTGSGILAIGAALLGCTRVTAFDNDPDAVLNAQENARLNHVEDTVRLFTGTTDAVSGHYDIVLANLLAHVIVELMPELNRLLAPGGHLILSGILNEQVDQIDAALAANGLKAKDYISRGMWLMVLGARP